MAGISQAFHRIHAQTRPIVGTIVYGLVASGAAVAFQLTLNWVFNRCYVSPTNGHFWRFAGVSLIVITVSSLIVGWLLNCFCPDAAGSGIPQVKLRFWKEFGAAPRRIALVKFVAGIVSIGGGQSLGREGPTVQIGSSLATTLAGTLGVSKQNRRAASAAGAAAGLAAAFNAPLAAIAFVLEEIIGDLNSRSLGAVLLASIVGAFVVHALVGPQPAFALPALAEPTWRAYLLMPLAAAFAAGVGLIFQRCTLRLRRLCKRVRSRLRWLLPLAGGLTTWAVGVLVVAKTGRLGVFGLGYGDLSDALLHGMVWRVALVLLIAKLIATIASYGFGGCGGIFSPNLFLGAMCGLVVTGLASRVLALSGSDGLLVAIGSMSACLGVVVQAPVTAILIIFEMTHQFAMVPGLMLAGLVSQALARGFQPANFYDEVLIQDGHEIKHLIPPRDLRSWQNLPISAITNFAPVALADWSDAGLRDLLENYPYRNFPAVEDGKVVGVVTRDAIAAALANHHKPVTTPAALCRPDDSIGASQAAVIESATGTVAVVRQSTNELMGFVTLHDLLRAQVSMSEREGPA